MKAPINTSNTRPEDFLVDSITVGTGNAIEMQEAQGQRSFVASETLPMDGPKAPLEAAGVKFLHPVEGDPIFQFVQLPEGWKKKATDHAMWSELVDDKGRKRAGIFYKAAFYDRSAHFYCDTRFSIHKDYDRKDESVAQVRDGEQIIFTAEPLKHLAGNDRETALKNYAMDDAVRKAAAEWLAARYPDWQNAAAYWD